MFAGGGDDRRRNIGFQPVCPADILPAVGGVIGVQLRWAHRLEAYVPTKYAGRMPAVPTGKMPVLPAGFFDELAASFDPVVGGIAG